MKQSNIFVIRDEVLFIKKEYHNRNKIRINSNDNIKNPQSKWLCVPVEDSDDYIMHVKIKRDSQQKNQSWEKIFLHEIEASYHKAPYFKNFFPELEKILNNSDSNLISLNMKIINFIKQVFNIKTPIILASELGLKPQHYIKSDASEDIAKICEKLKADIYLSGPGGRTYLKFQPFDSRGIEVKFQEYRHPIYQQHLPGFLPYMASIDALFCTGRIPKVEVIEKEIMVNNLQ